MFCDCDLLWILEWSTKSSGKLLSNPKCNHPFKGKALRKLKIGLDIHCKSPARNIEVPSLQLSPNHSQIVFEGDSLKLYCVALTVDDLLELQDAQISDNVTWTWDQSNNFNKEILINNKNFNDQGIITSTLVIEKIHQSHTGCWSCQLLTSKGNHSKDISIIVISKETKYCPILTTSDNKGTYKWPQTIANNTLLMPCASMQQNNDILTQEATYTCSDNGTWTNLDTSKCGYISETTKILEQFSKVNLTVTKATLLESAKHFRNYTSNLSILKDKMDLIFIVRTMENYLNYLEDEKELGSILLDITNNLLNLPISIINQIDISQLSRIITKVSSCTESQLLHKDNIALEEFTVDEESFNGMTCTWYVDAIDDKDRLFQCTNVNQSTLMGFQNRMIEASIQIPFNIFSNIKEDHRNFAKNLHTLKIVMYRNNNFFPVKAKNKEIISAVVGTQLGKKSLFIKSLVSNLIKLRTFYKKFRMQKYL